MAKEKMKTDRIPKQTNFDKAVDAFMETFRDQSDLSDEEHDEFVEDNCLALIAGLESFRDVLRDQMGCDKFYSTYEKIGKLEERN